MSDPVDQLPRQPAFASLTPREKETLRRTAAGDSAKEIGRALGISHRTVHNYQQEAARKLGVSGSVRAARLLSEHETRGGVDVHPVLDPVAKSSETVLSPSPSASLPAGRIVTLTTLQVLLIVLAWGVGCGVILAAVTYLYTSLT